jgi:Xaa-Pro aminopeptidase
MELVMTRLTSLRKAMQDSGEDVFLVTEGKNRRYLSGFTGSSGWLVISRDRDFLITDGRYWDQVAGQCPKLELFRYLPAEHKTLTGALRALLVDELGLSGGACVGVELDDLPVVLYRSIVEMLKESEYDPRDVEGRTKEHRTCKDDDELDCLRRAATIADEALSVALSLFRPGASEADLKAEIDYQVLRHGGEGAAFPTIVASGANGSYPHAGASAKPIVANELVTIDFGAIWKGYCSDMTRTIWFGTLAEEERRLVESVAAAQARAVSAARPGMTTGDLDEVARACLREAGLADYFVHSLGHGVGLDVHERPTLRSGETEVLQARQVITIEPGVYLPGKTGCRIEDTVVLTADGCEVLNRFPKQTLADASPPTLV